MIVGAPGGGKTRLARRLSARLGVPHVELDAVIYEGGAGAKRTYEERLALLGRIQSAPAWVAEGNYLWWAEGLYEAADVVIWIDVPWPVAAARVVRRHVAASLRGDNRHPGVVKLARFLWRYRGYYMSDAPDVPSGPDDDRAGNRVATELFLRRYEGKLVRCRSRREVGEFLAGVTRRAP